MRLYRRARRGILHRTGSVDAVAALASVAGIGPYFVVDTADSAPGWRPINDLYSNDGDALDGLVTTFAERLRTAERRVAASIFFQGYAARLWSPVLACVALKLPLPDLSAQRLHWRYLPGEPLGLLVTRPDAWAVTGEQIVEFVVAEIVDEHLTPMVGALRGLTGVAEQLLWGNASSALAGTLTVLRSAGVPIDAALAAVFGLLDAGPLRGTGTLTADGSAFRRRSCCLYYRVPGGGLCGDCVLAS